MDQVNPYVACGTCRLSSLIRETGLSAEKVAECLRLATGTVSLDRPIEEGGDSLGDFVLQQPDNEADPAQLIDRTALRQLIRDALTDLTEREATIIALRAGLDSDEPQTLDEIGKVLGVTRERVRQIEKEARTKLRTALTARGLEPLRPPRIFERWQLKQAGKIQERCKRQTAIG